MFLFCFITLSCNLCSPLSQLLCQSQVDTSFGSGISSCRKASTGDPPLLIPFSSRLGVPSLYPHTSSPITIVASNKEHFKMNLHTEETRIVRDTCTPMFIAALFIIARTWKQPRCPSADEWIRKLWYIYTMEYYSAVKKNSFESVLMRWMKLEPIIQSEVSQKEKHQYSILTHIYGI